MRWPVWMVIALWAGAVPALGVSQESEREKSLEERVRALEERLGKPEREKSLEERVRALEERMEKAEWQKSVEERVRPLEERLDKLDKAEVIKQVKEYVCPGGEIYDSPPPGGRCPDGSQAEEQVSLKKFKFSRREELGEKIEAVMRDAELRRVSVGGSVRGIIQQPLNVRKNSKVFAEGSADVVLLSRPMAFMTAFVDLEVIGGAGADEAAGSLSRLNADGERFGPGVKDQVKVREAWLNLRLMANRVLAVGGLIDITNYFDRNLVANDETTRFLNGALVNNPTLKSPPNGPGLAVRYEADRDIGLAVGVQSPNRSGATVADKVYAIAEVDYQTHFLPFGLGNYRLWGRFGRVADDLDRDSWGGGVSVDQQLTPHLTAFARVGVGRTGGDRILSHAWSLGLQLSPPFPTRTRDRVGLAFSRQVEPGGRENVGEGYYFFFLTERLAVSPDLQWIFSGPNTVTGQRNRNVLIPGLRVTVNF